MVGSSQPSQHPGTWKLHSMEFYNRIAAKTSPSSTLGDGLCTKPLLPSSSEAKDDPPRPIVPPTCHQPVQPWHSIHNRDKPGSTRPTMPYLPLPFHGASYQQNTARYTLCIKHPKKVTSAPYQANRPKNSAESSGPQRRPPTYVMPCLDTVQYGRIGCCSSEIAQEDCVILSLQHLRQCWSWHYHVCIYPTVVVAQRLPSLCPLWCSSTVSSHVGFQDRTSW